jgi:hypothetical protein
MKQKIFLFFLISINLQVFAQNYAPVNPQWIYYYEPTTAHRIFLKRTKHNWGINKKYIKGIRVDSTKFENGFTVHYLQKELELDELFQEDGCWDLFILPRNGWVGNKILVNGSYYIFYNDNNDSIFIKTDANPGENWIMYESEIFTITANITKLDTISFLGVTDSAKFIEISVFDTNKTLLDIKTLQDPLILSRNHGFIQLYNFKHFPDTNSKDQILFSHNLVGIPEKNLGISNLTNEDVYDYEIGDEFHYYTTKHYWSDEYKISTCIGKIVSKGNDSIVYTFRNIRKYREGSDLYIRIDTNILGYSLSNLPVIGTLELPLENIGPRQYYELYYFYLFYKGFNDKLEIRYYRDPYQPPEGCPKWESILYIEGIGKLRRYLSWEPHGGFSDASDYLLYYKKGEEEWGEPIFINTNVNINNSNSYMFFPNPTSGEIYVNFNLNKNPQSISVISTSGRVLYKKSTDIRTTETINLNGNVPGIYYLIVNYEDEIVREKIILIY